MVIDTTAATTPMMIRFGSCAHLSPIGQPISNNPAAIRYVHASVMLSPRLADSLHATA